MTTVPDDPILICYDGSHEADLAIDAAAALLGPRRAVVLDVGPPLTPEESLAVLAPVAPAGALRELNAEDALDRAKAGAARATGAGFTAEARGIVDAPVWAGIIDVANEIGAAAIVLGSRSRDAGREVLEGSVSHDVARHATCPVLIVPSHGERRHAAP